MNWDQPEFSFDNGQPPTPSQTPHSPSFGEMFQTPRLDSNFLDAKSSWNSSDPPNNFADILKTPRALLFSTSNVNSPALQSKPLQDERQSASSSLLANAEKLLSTPSFEGMRADQTPRFEHSSSFNRSITQTALPEDLSLNTSLSFNTASSMQTPPPTSGSASKRRVQQSEGRVKASRTANERRMSVPIAPKPVLKEDAISPVDASNQPQSALEFSPGAFGYDFLSPTTAPAYPSAKLLWGTDENAQSNLEFLTNTPGLFGAPQQSQGDPFGFNTTTASNPPHPAATNSHNIASENATFGQTAFEAGLSPQKERYSSRPQSAVVNPSLLLSSPTKALGGPNQHNVSNRADNEALQPYAYQMQEARRDRASFGIAKHKKRRKPSMDSPAVQAALETLRDDGQRPQFRRSMTDSALPALSRSTYHSAAAIPHRRSSPLKRNREPSKRGKQRASVALTIDENGRARTETRVVEDSENSSDNDEMEIDHHSHDSSSSSSDDGSDMAAAPKTAMPRLGRFNHSASHSKKSSYTSMYSSNSYQDDPKLPEPKDRATINAGRSFGGQPLQPLKEASFGSDQGHGPNDVAMESDGEDQTAQSELRRLAQRRQSAHRNITLHTGAFAEIHDSGVANLSPTTITDPDLATPTSGQSTASGGIRCVCSVAIDDGQMIQCESCRNWLHVPCTGLQPQRLPHIYLCLFCTGSTPVARGGRVRDPARKAFVAPPSPLAHKTARFR